MGKISVNTEELQKNAAHLKQQYTQLKSLNAKLEALLGTIETGWTGSASVAYIGMMRNYLKQGKKMESVLLEYQKYADNTANQFSSGDRNLANRIRNSF